jgi:hypothetical protein
LTGNIVYVHDGRTYRTNCEEKAMNTVVRIADRLARKAVGHVDAGACNSLRGCCCSGTTYGINCYGNCVKMSCTTVYSAYHVLCSTG